MTTSTDRIFTSSASRGWGPQNVPLTFSQIEATEFRNASPQHRATAFAEVVHNGDRNDDGTERWIVFLDYAEYVTGDEDAYIVGIFGGSKEDAEELARLVRESA
jgi:hypothetical protein